MLQYIMCELLCQEWECFHVFCSEVVCIWCRRIIQIGYCLIFILADNRSWTLLGLQDRWKKYSCTPGSECWNWLSGADGFNSASTCRCALSGTIHLSGEERILQSSCSVYSWGSCWGNVLCHIELLTCNWVNNLGVLLPVYFLFFPFFSADQSSQNRLICFFSRTQKFLVLNWEALAEWSKIKTKTSSESESVAFFGTVFMLLSSVSTNSSDYFGSLCWDE